MTSEEQLTEIRLISNVCQALENLMVQCGDAPDPVYEELRNFVAERSFYFGLRLQKTIHTPTEQV